MGPEEWAEKVAKAKQCRECASDIGPSVEYFTVTDYRKDGKHLGQESYFCSRQCRKKHINKEAGQ